MSQNVITTAAAAATTTTTWRLTLVMYRFCHVKFVGHNINISYRHHA